VLRSYDRQVPIVDYRETQPPPVTRVAMDAAEES
jgi:hypothetical protein